MNDRDRTLLNQIDQAWDAINRGEPDRTEDGAGGFVQVIETLRKADLNASPSPEFRARLRQQILKANGPTPDHVPEIPRSGADESQQQPTTSRPDQQFGDSEMERRNWWIRHAGELAAIVLILVVAAAGVAWWQSDGSFGGFQPGASGDDANEDVETIATPEPQAPGVWTGLTFEEAQAVTPFELRMPPEIPDGYEIGEIVVVHESTREASTGNPLPQRDDDEPWTYATIELFPEAGTESPPIAITYRNSRQQVPMELAGRGPAIIEGDDVEMGIQSYPVDTTTEQRAINGVEVNYTLQDVDDGVQHVLYLWHQDGLSIAIASSNFPRDPEAGIGFDRPDIEKMERVVEAIILERESDEEPPEWPGFAEPPDGSEPAPGSQPRTGQQSTITDGLTLDEATDLLGRDLVDPEASADLHGFSIESITVTEPPMGETFDARFTMYSDAGQQTGFTLLQANRRLTIQEVSDFGYEGVPAPVQEEITINGVDVTRTVQYSLNGDELTGYLWYQDGLGLSAYGWTDVGADGEEVPGITILADDLAAFVEAVIADRANEDEPPLPDGGTAPDGTATSRQYESLNLSEVREAVPFDLIDLDSLPGNLMPGPVLARFQEGGSPTEIENLEDANTVHLHLTTMLGREPVQALEIIQTEDMIPNEPGEMIEVNGHPVEVVSGFMGSNALQTAWIWEVDGITYGLMVTTMVMGDAATLDEIEPAPVIGEPEIFALIESTLP